MNRMYGYIILTVALTILYFLMIQVNNKAEEKKIEAN